MGQSLAKQDVIYKLAEKRVNVLLSEISEHLNTASELSDNLIHELRVCVKRLRALLQLYQPSAKQRDIKKLDHDIKRIANAFSGKRDIVVQHQLLSKAINEIGHHEGEFQLLIDHFQNLLTQENITSQVLVVDKAFKRVLKKWHQHLKMTKRKSVDAGLTHTHDQCYLLAHRAIATGNDEAYHAARKWIKYYLYQLKLLNKKRIAPDVECAIKQLDDMGALLGDLHDQSVLECTLQSLLDKSDHVALKQEIMPILAWLQDQKQRYKQQFWPQFNHFFLQSKRVVKK